MAKPKLKPQDPSKEPIAVEVKQYDEVVSNETEVSVNNDVEPTSFDAVEELTQEFEKQITSDLDEQLTQDFPEDFGELDKKSLPEELSNEEVKDLLDKTRDCVDIFEEDPSEDFDNNVFEDGDQSNVNMQKEFFEFTRGELEALLSEAMEFGYNGPSLTAAGRSYFNEKHYYIQSKLQ